MCCSKEPICAGHLKPRMFMASVLEAGRKPDTDPHLFTRWSLPCSSLVSPSLFPSPSVCLFPSLSVLPLSGGLCAAHKDGPACIPQLRVRSFELLNYSSHPPPRASVISQAEFSVCLESKAPFPYLYFPPPPLFFPPHLLSPRFEPQGPWHT